MADNYDDFKKKFEIINSMKNDFVQRWKNSLHYVTFFVFAQSGTVKPGDIELLSESGIGLIETVEKDETYFDLKETLEGRTIKLEGMKNSSCRTRISFAYSIMSDAVISSVINAPELMFDNLLKAEIISYKYLEHESH